MASHNLAWLAILAVAAVLSWLLVSGGEDAKEAPFRVAIPSGYYLKQAEVTETGPDGQVLYHMTAEQALQAADLSVELTTVALDYRGVSESPWQFSADRGRIPTGQTVIELRGNVLATEVDETNPDPTVIRTEALDLDPDTHTANAPGKVSIDMGEHRLRGTGLIAYLKDDRLRLQSNVNGKFYP